MKASCQPVSISWVAVPARRFKGGGKILPRRLHRKTRPGDAALAGWNGQPAVIDNDSGASEEMLAGHGGVAIVWLARGNGLGSSRAEKQKKNLREGVAIP
jgi:hypothetical protein